MEPLSVEWIAALADASGGATADQIGDRSGLVEFKLGKKERAVISFDSGRFAGPAPDDGEIELSLPFADAAELSEYLSGRDSMAKAYIRGDFKPVGSTGVLLSVIELVESGALKPLA